MPRWRMSFKWLRWSEPVGDRVVAALIADQLGCDLRCGRVGWIVVFDDDVERCDSLKLSVRLERARLVRAEVVVVKEESRSVSGGDGKG